MMGGQLEVKSEHGKGSEFYFSIWQTVAAGVESTIASGVTKQAWQSEEEFVAPEARILVVDDTEINLMVTEELLKTLHMTVDTADSGNNNNFLERHGDFYADRIHLDRPKEDIFGAAVVVYDLSSDERKAVDPDGIFEAA